MIPFLYYETIAIQQDLVKAAQLNCPEKINDYRMRSCFTLLQKVFEGNRKWNHVPVVAEKLDG
jgi:hypothetical protein